MKKKYIIILLIILLVCGLVFISIKAIKSKQERDELEAVQIFNNIAKLKVTVENSYENINDIQNQLEDLEYVKSVELISKDDAVENFKQEMENIVNTDSIDELREVISDSFIVNLEVKSVDDFEKIKTLDDNIASIDGVEEVGSSGCNEIIEVYKKTGIKGLREYNKVLNIMKEQGVEGITNYLNEHGETRKLLKDFIHF